MPIYPDCEDASDPECMPHGHRWRSRFQCILNQLRAHPDSSKLEKSDIDKIPFAVCTCTQKPRDDTVQLEPDKRWEEIPINEYKAAEKYFENFIESLDKSSEYYSLLKYHFTALQKHEELKDKSSSQRFLLVFQRIHHLNDRELLNRPTRRAGGSEEDKRIKQTIHLASLKKDYVPLYCGRNGRNMKRYLKGKKKVKVQLETRDEDQVYATITCKSQDREKIVERLTKEAELLAERRRIHDENQREYYRRMGLDDDMDTNSQEEDDMDS